MKNWKELNRSINRTMIRVLLVCGLVFACGFYFGCQFTQSLATDEQSGQFNLPTIEKVQEFLECKKVDGKLGPETQAKWDAALNAELFNGYAAKYFTKEFYLKQKAGTPCKSEK